MTPPISNETYGGLEHAPESPGSDGQGYGRCVACRGLWPCLSEVERIRHEATESGLAARKAAIERELRQDPLPIADPLERRAIALKLAIDTKNVAFSLKDDGDEIGPKVVACARLYEDFITNG